MNEELMKLVQLLWEAREIAKKYNDVKDEHLTVSFVETAFNSLTMELIDMGMEIKSNQIALAARNAMVRALEDL